MVTKEPTSVRPVSAGEADLLTSQRCYVYWRSSSGFWIRRVVCSKQGHGGPLTAAASPTARPRIVGPARHAV